MLASVYHILYMFIPTTIHPMVVHFTIAILYLAVLADLIGFFWKSEFYERAGFIMLGLGVLATIAAGFAGVLSENADKLTPQAVALIHTHASFGELTGIVFLAAWVVRLMTRYKKSGRVFGPSLILSLIGLALLTYVGHLGGALVYDHGVGVNAVGLGRIHP
ncbi:DUF2231 domain-containing protein [Ferroacidibacillus organovorans]|uniref:DUF2231 domain-containing protein n=1 Tax=Ferroacidibacillus organovorans TaxID=1765683 RepID=A0A162U506_9BACL|nr:DUF2231 domain-containing protein [Ferroacidibacillus organovorans]KYP81405.1 hypothetical protein AYJ22_01175 [Ferroacidibacillus organovorans]OAG95192.1 hypothetical protein AYW79_01775 [Ferroacidibacillus organovorans]OPG15184.1 hypothetical protein B2M26_13635 [Ferroacidibacillus organovorans]